MSVDQIPEEILSIIFSFLKPVEYIQTIQYINKEIHEIINQEKLWKDICFSNYNAKNIEEFFKYLQSDINLKQFYYFNMKNPTHFISNKEITSNDNKKYSMPMKLTYSDQSIQSNVPIPKDSKIFYFEIKSNFSNLSIGISHEGYSPSFQIGWGKCSVGYHGDDGGIYLENDSTPKFRFETILNGDVIGCGINLPTKHIFFTKNGNLMIIPCKLKANELICASIGMFGHGDIEANFDLKQISFMK
eukprot:gene11937-5338_t